MIIFGGSGYIHDLFRAELYGLCVELYRDKGLKPDQLAETVWQFINEYLDPLCIPEAAKQGFIDRIADAINSKPTDVWRLVQQLEAGDEAARHHVAHLIESLSRRKLPIPEPFAVLVADILTGELPLTKPKGRPKKTVRDQKIALVIDVLLTCNPDLSPFRNEINRIRRKPTPSACSIVADMLMNHLPIGVTEKAIEAIYTTHCKSLNNTLDYLGR